MSALLPPYRMPLSPFFKSAAVFASSQSAPRLNRLCLHPKLWPGCLLLAVLRLMALLPFHVQRFFGAGLGRLMYRVNAKRRRIAQINLTLCFPELTVEERNRLLRRHFRTLGQSYLDAGFLAWASESRFTDRIRLVGEDFLRAPVEQKRNIILLAPHCVGLNVGGIVLAKDTRVFSMVKEQPNPVVNWLLYKIRSRYGSPLIERNKGLRPVMRGLKQGFAFYYLPDEDLGPDRSVFVPFFGIPTATLPMLGRLARMTDAIVVPCFTRLIPDGYEVILHPPLTDFPSDDRIRDAACMNEEFERGIREMPEQYMWTFKLFKSRPEGVPSPYA